MNSKIYCLSFETRYFISHRKFEFLNILLETAFFKKTKINHLQITKSSTKSPKYIINRSIHHFYLILSKYVIIDVRRYQNGEGTGGAWRRPHTNGMRVGDSILLFQKYFSELMNEYNYIFSIYMCVFIYVIYHENIFLCNCRSQQTIFVIMVLSYNNELTLDFNEGSTSL